MTVITKETFHCKDVYGKIRLKQLQKNHAMKYSIV